MTTAQGGRRSLVIGGGTGIGLACARAFCADDGRVFISGRREAPLAAAAAFAPAQIAYATGDAIDEQDMQRVVHSALDFLHELDTVVVCAGMSGVTGVLDSSLVEFSRIVNGNLFPVFLAARYTAQHLISSGRGCLIAISSMYGLVGLRQRAAYSAGKAGINGMIRSIALDLADKGVRVNAICPGFIETKFSLDMVSREADPAAELTRRRAMHPIPRAGSADEVAAMAVFLASDGAAWITGQTYAVDGGYTAR